jgi:putative flippase GtrA
MLKYNVHNQKLKQLLKYVAVGATSFATEYGVFSIALFLSPDSPGWLLFSQSVSYLVALVVNFMGSSKVTFSQNSHKFKNTRSKQIILFAALSFTNLIISNIVIYSLTQYENLSPFIAKLVVMILITGWNYLIFSRHIFKSAK